MSTWGAVAVIVLGLIGINNLSSKDKQEVENEYESETKDVEDYYQSVKDYHEDKYDSDKQKDTVKVAESKFYVGQIVQTIRGSGTIEQSYLVNNAWQYRIMLKSGESAGFFEFQINPLPYDNEVWTVVTPSMDDLDLSSQLIQGYIYGESDMNRVIVNNLINDGMSTYWVHKDKFIESEQRNRIVAGNLQRGFIRDTLQATRDFIEVRDRLI